MITRHFKELLAELILLAILVGFIPELIVNGASNVFGACGFTSEVCHGIAIEGAMKLIAAWICTICAVVVALLISKEFKVTTLEDV